MSHRNVPGCDIQDHLGNEKWVKPGCTVAFGEIDDFFLESDQAADAAGKNNADPVRIHSLFVNTCILYRLIAGRQGNLSIAIDLPGLLFFQVLQSIEPF